jgi:replicative DNA helicase
MEPKRKIIELESSLEYGKLLPQAVEIEELIIGAMMIEPHCIPDVFSIISDDSFYRESHRIIFQAIKYLYDKNKSVDIVTVVDQLRKSENLEVSGGAHYITQLTARVASSSHVEDHAKIILEKHIKRELIRVSTQITMDNFEDNTDCFDNLDNADRLLSEVSELSTNGGNISHVSVSVDDSITDAKIREKLAKEGIVSGITTGIYDLDKRIYGWQNDDLIILAARPGMGKTAAMVHFAKSAATAGIPVALFELEMTRQRLTDRLIVSESGVDYDKYRSGFLNKLDWDLISNAGSKISKLPIYIDDKSGVTMRYIKSQAKILKKRGKCGIVMIDYLQLCNMAMDKSNRNREQEVSEASLQAKNMAKDLHVPVILLCQLSRDVEKRGGDKKPVLSDLRESGAIEQNADCVIFIYRPDYYGIKDQSGESLAGQGQLIIAKLREGATGEIYFKHNESLTQFYDYNKKIEHENVYS